MTPEPAPAVGQDKLDEVLADYLDKLETGGAPDRQELLRQHPDLADDLRSFFADQDRFDDLLAPIRQATTTVLPRRRSALTMTWVPPLHSFGDYEILEEIARSGMGVVYRARQVSLDRLVAMKMILAGEFASVDDATRFQLEAQAAASLDHPHIVPIYEVGEHEGRPYFSMKLVEGGSLAQHVHRQRPVAREAARLLLTVARAVDYAHQRGILHRDLKPANVLLDAQGQPHLTDFGLAKRFQGGPDLTPTGAALGTPSYMAPEQAAPARSGAPQPGLTTRADVYGLGAILYECLTGRPPFRGTTPLETLLQVLERDPEWPRALNPAVDRDLETICLKCLEKQPEKRYPSAAAVAEELERYLRGETILARPVGPVARAWRWCRRQPIVAGLMAALVVALVLIGWQWRRAEDSLADVRNLAWEKEQQRERAEELRRAEMIQRDLAEKRFAELRGVVDQFAFLVNRARGQELPVLQPLCKAMLEVVGAYYEKFLQQRGGDPGLRIDLAVTHFRLGDVNAVLGRRAQAIREFGKARELLEKLVAEQPDKRGQRSNLGAIWNRIGNLELDLGHTEAARDAYRQALPIFEQLRRERPNDRDACLGMSDVSNNLAILSKQAGQPDEARASYERKIAALRAYLKTDPADRGFQVALADGYLGLGSLQEGSGQAEQSLRSFETARKLLAEVKRSGGGHAEADYHLARVELKIGVRHNVPGKRSEALGLLRRAEDRLARLTKEYPGVARYLMRQAETKRFLGHVLTGDGKLGDALAHYEAARSILEELTRHDKQSIDLHSDLAKCLFDRSAVLSRQGKRAEALVSYKRSALIRRQLVRLCPGRYDLSSDLGLTLHNQAVVEFNSRRRADALTTAKEARDHLAAAHQGRPGNLTHRRRLSGTCDLLAHIYRFLGRPAEAVAVAREREKLWSSNGSELYNVATDLASTATSVGRGKTALSAAERDERDRYAGLAVECLKRALGAGFKDFGKMEKDKRLDVLRGRKDFPAVPKPRPAKAPAVRT